MDIASIDSLMVISALAIALAMSLNEWRHGDNVECRRLSAIFGAMVVLRAPYLLWDVDVLFPPLRPFVDTFGLVLTLWAFSRPFFDRRRLAILRNILLAAAAAGLLGTYIAWLGSRQVTPWTLYTGHWSATIWHLAQAGLAALGMWVMLSRPREGRGALIAAFSVWMIAAALALLGYSSIILPAGALFYPLVAIATYQTITNDLRSFGEELKALSQRALSRTKGQIFLLEVSRAASAPVELSVILQIITDYGGLAFDADRVLVLIYDESRPGFMRVAARFSPLTMEDSADEQTHLLLPDFPLLQHVEQERVSHRWERIDPRQQEDGRSLRGLSQLVGLEDLGPLIIQPLVIQGRVAGFVLGARSLARPPFSEEESQLVSVMASLVAATLENSRLYQELSDVNRELTRLNDDLKNAYQRLKELDELKSSFMGLITHELRTPFVDLDLSLQLMRRHGVANWDQPQLELLAQFEKGVQRARQMIDSLVSFASLLSKRGELFIERADFAKVVDQAVEVLSPMARGRQVEIVLKAGTKPLWVEMDSRRIGEAVQHLLHNAIKFNRVGGTIIARFWSDGGHVMFEVEDSGIGIPADRLERIWEQFTQVADPVRRGAEGLGIGLAMVRLIVEAHGGEVAAQSRLGEGSIFGFRLPVSHEPDGESTFAAWDIVSPRSPSLK